MKINYKITEQILNNIYSFSNLHGRLYTIDHDQYWLKELKKINDRKSGIAATTIDQNLNNPNAKFIVNEEYENYTRAKRMIEKNFSSYDKLSVGLIKELSAIIQGQTIKTLRKNKTILPKIIKKNNVYSTVQLSIKTQPDEINNSLIKYFRWVRSNIFTSNPVILAAISHINLVAIHPLEDGNGRLARVFEHGLLYLNNIDPNNIIPQEEFYLNTRDRYYDLIEQNIKNNDITTWIDYYCEGLNTSILNTVKQLKEMSCNTIDLENRRIIDLTPKEIEVVNKIKSKVQCSGAEIAKELNVSRQNINTIIKRLIKKDVIVKLGAGSSSRYMIK